MPSDEKGGTILVQSKEELAEFLKERTLLKVLDERVIEGITGLFTELVCGPGHIVFSQGDEPDAIYFIREGSVEVLQSRAGAPARVIAYLASGDCFGEMSLMQDSKRNGTIRVPEEAVLLRLSRKAFNELQTHFPEVTREINKLVSKREAGNLPFSAPGLQGNLAFFDLPTVIQTVVGSRQSGVLFLRDRGGKPAAQLHIRQGRLVYASYVHLTGECALFEMIARGEALDFQFEQQAEPDPAIPVDRNLSAQEPYKLLIEGARRADELPKLMASLDWPAAIFVPGKKTPDWSAQKDGWAAVARKMWFLLEAGLTLQQVSQKLPYDRYTILSAVQEMLAAEIVVNREGAAPIAAKPVHEPSDIASAITAINAITVNLTAIFGKDLVYAVLTRALAEASGKYTHLQSLSVRPQTCTLDLRMAKPDVSQSEASFASLKYLARTIIRLAAASIDD